MQLIFVDVFCKCVRKSSVIRLCVRACVREYVCVCMCVCVSYSNLSLSYICFNQFRRDICTHTQIRRLVQKQVTTFSLLVFTSHLSIINSNIQAHYEAEDSILSKQCVLSVAIVTDHSLGGTMNQCLH